MSNFIDGLLQKIALSLRPHFRRLDINEALERGDFTRAQMLIALDPALATAEQRQAATERTVPR